MADAAVQERPPTRFYCHVCNVEFQNTSNNFTCPHCSDGFIEELQDNGERNTLPNLDFSADGEWVDADDDMENAGLLLSSRVGTRGQENGGPMDGRYSGLPRVPNLWNSLPSEVFPDYMEVATSCNFSKNEYIDISLQQLILLTVPPRTLTRLASSNLRQQLPIEHLVHDFIINLGVGVNWGGPGNVQLFLGNPGDYAWGREGLDAIVTQLLNQMDSTGPPPVPKAVIDALQVVDVSEEQVKQNVQCSVCWEHFHLKEQVRQLPCLHIYHESCIRPWLELHGTCPICRQNLGEGEGGNPVATDLTGVESATGQATNVQNVLRTLFGPSPSGSPTPSGGTTSQMDQSGSSSRTQNGDATM